MRINAADDVREALDQFLDKPHGNHEEELISAMHQYQIHWVNVADNSIPPGPANPPPRKRMQKL